MKNNKLIKLKSLKDISSQREFRYPLIEEDSLREDMSDTLENCFNKVISDIGNVFRYAPNLGGIYIPKMARTNGRDYPAEGFALLHREDNYIDLRKELASILSIALDFLSIFIYESKGQIEFSCYFNNVESYNYVLKFEIDKVANSISFIRKPAHMSLYDLSIIKPCFNFIISNYYPNMNVLGMYEEYSKEL